jgi:hypothetical protein
LNHADLPSWTIRGKNKVFAAPGRTAKTSRKIGKPESRLSGNWKQKPLSSGFCRFQKSYLFFFTLATVLFVFSIEQLYPDKNDH